MTTDPKPDPLTVARARRWPPEALQGCGTYAAARRHIANGETRVGPRGGVRPDCDACDAAMVAYRTEAQARRRARRKTGT